MTRAIYHHFLTEKVHQYFLRMSTLRVLRIYEVPIDVSINFNGAIPTKHVYINIFSAANVGSVTSIDRNNYYTRIQGKSSRKCIKYCTTVSLSMKKYMACQWSELVKHTQVDNTYEPVSKTPTHADLQKRLHSWTKNAGNKRLYWEFYTGTFHLTGKVLHIFYWQLLPLFSRLCCNCLLFGIPT